MTKQATLWSKKGKPGPYDVIVIGSGMGGMTTAALLAKLGRRVLVLEQHYVPGGFTHMFTRKNYIWDVGVHAVGEVSDHSLVGRLLSRLTDNELQWESLGPVYDEFHFPDDFRIDFPDSPQQFRANLHAAFPDETQAIDGYLRYVREVSGAMRGYYLGKALPAWASPVADLTVGRKAQEFLEMRTSDILNKLTSNRRLQAVLASQWGYYGATPARSSFAIQALVTKHFMFGGYYPRGGAKRIAETLLKTVADAGGWTRVRADVERIIIEDGQAVGVQLSDGEAIFAETIVSATGVVSTAERLLPPEYQNAAWLQSVRDLNPAPAHVCLYIGFTGDIRSAGAGPANKWFYNTWDMEAAGWEIDDPDNLQDAPCLYCSFPSLKDPEHDPGPELRHTGEVVTFVPWEAFSKWQDTRWYKRGADYDALKRKLADHLLEQFLQRLPELRPMVDYVELSTPLSTDNFTRPIKGSIYGIEPTPERFQNKWLRPRSPISKLFFSGSEVATVGVIGAMVGGVLAALAAEPIDVLRFIRDVR